MHYTIVTREWWLFYWLIWLVFYAVIKISSLPHDRDRNYSWRKPGSIRRKPCPPAVCWQTHNDPFSMYRSRQYSVKGVPYCRKNIQCHWSFMRRVTTLRSKAQPTLHWENSLRQHRSRFNNIILLSHSFPDGKSRVIYGFMEGVHLWAGSAFPELAVWETVSEGVSLTLWRQSSQ